jgi:hypothetical protein
MFSTLLATSGICMLIHHCIIFLFQISKEIPRENIECSGGPLGEGQFGEVFKGRYTRADGKVVDAAIKMCKATAGNKELVEFLREAAIMGQFDHPHIIAIFG